MAGSLIVSVREWLRRAKLYPTRPVRIGIALGGGFARGIAHIGVLKALERAAIPLHAIAGVSAGSIVAALYASGLTPAEIERAAAVMRFADIGRWTISKQGLALTDRMEKFLSRLLKVTRFEQMRIPLAIVASDLISGTPAIFKDQGDVILPVRASCAYPGLFAPVRNNGCCLVDGMITMDVPARPLRDMGCTHVISVALPDAADCTDPGNLFGVVTRSFQVLNSRTQADWRRFTDVVVAPDVSRSSWDSFRQCAELIAAGERAGQAAIPQMLRWLGGIAPSSAAVA